MNNRTLAPIASLATICALTLTACGGSTGGGSDGSAGSSGESDLKTMLKRAQDCAEVSKVVEATYGSPPDGAQLEPFESETAVGCRARWENIDELGISNTASLTLFVITDKRANSLTDDLVEINSFECWHNSMYNPILECPIPPTEGVVVSLDSGQGRRYITEEAQAFAPELENIMKEYAAYLTS